MRLEMSFLNPENILAVYVDARTVGNDRVVRWYWDVRSSEQPSVKPKTFVFVPERDCAWFRHTKYSSGSTTVLYIYVRVSASAEAGFRLRRLELGKR